MLEAAEAQLNASPDRDIATRAVCEAVGVGPPVLYRLFGDKQGLLRALVDYGFERYLSIKRSAVPSARPADDLRAGWDAHVAFAIAHPAVYRLMYSPAFTSLPHAASDALSLLRDLLNRCAAAGLLRVDADEAAQAIMAANVGVALSLLTQPAKYDDPDLSRRVRDAVLAGVLVEANPAPEPEGGQVAAGARTLAAALTSAPPEDVLDSAELALLQRWLARLSRPTP